MRLAVIPAAVAVLALALTPALAQQKKRQPLNIEGAVAKVVGIR